MNEDGEDTICPKKSYGKKAKEMMGDKKKVDTEREELNTYIGCAGEMEEDSI